MPSYCSSNAEHADRYDLYTCNDSDRGYGCRWCDNQECYPCQECYDGSYCEDAEPFEDQEDRDEYLRFDNPAGIVDGCSCQACERNRTGDRSARCSAVWPVGINSYSHKPPMTFWHTGGLSRNKLTGKFGARETYMGCEIEVEFRGTHEASELLRNAWSAHYDLAERLYCKDDSSLVNGVEIVSFPMTLDAWQELHAAGELDLYRKCQEAGTQSTRRCGMHVHVNRSSFTSLAHQARFTALIIRNAAHMQEVAKRIEESYASFQRFNACQVLKGFRGAPRGAVNLANSATIEVRMFASTQTPDDILTNLEFVHACQAFTRGRSTVDGCKVPIREALQFCTFGPWLIENEDQYPHAARLPVVRQYATGGNA